MTLEEQIEVSSSNTTNLFHFCRLLQPKCSINHFLLVVFLFFLFFRRSIQVLLTSLRELVAQTLHSLSTTVRVQYSKGFSNQEVNLTIPDFYNFCQRQLSLSVLILTPLLLLSLSIYWFLHGRMKRELHELPSI